MERYDKDVSSSKLVYGLNAIPIKFQLVFLEEHDGIILKCVWKKQRLEIITTL